MLKSQCTQFCPRLNLDAQYYKLLFLKVICSVFTYAFPVFSELNISANLTMLSPQGCPIFQLLAEETRMPQVMGFIVVVISHGWHLKDKRGRKAPRGEDVSV